MCVYKSTLYYGLKVDCIENGPLPNGKRACLKVMIKEKGEDLMHEGIHILPQIVYIS